MKRWCKAEELVKRILAESGDDPIAIHGVSHWMRVLRNGVWIGRRSGADLFVVGLFAWFHDSMRVNDNHDPEHGKRAADFARKLRGNLFDLENEAFELLYYACEWHTNEKHSSDCTIGTCWDADRHDLGRVGQIPSADFMSTDFGKKVALSGSFYEYLENSEKAEQFDADNFETLACLCVPDL